MATVPLPSAPTMWLSVNVARMIVVVPAPETDDATAVTACSRPTADIAGLTELLNGTVFMDLNIAEFAHETGELRYRYTHLVVHKSAASV
jgi:hypothetical protein